MGILKNLVIAVTGTLGADAPQLKKWIEANDGRYSPSVRKGVTHLVTGPDAWKNATDPVQAAVQVGALVVSYDWLEDSLQRKRKLAETKYTWEYLWQERKRRKQMKRLGTLNDTMKFNDGCREANKATSTGTSKSRTAARKPKPSTSFFFADVVNVPFVSAADDLKRRREEREAGKATRAEEAAASKVEDAKSNRAGPHAAASLTEKLSSPSSATSQALGSASLQIAAPAGLEAKKPSLKDLYHYYLDITGFEYKIILTRCDLRAGEISRYRLSILESHTKPHVYCTFVEYFPPGTGVAGAGEAGCIQALMDYTTTFLDCRAEEPDTDSTSIDNDEETPHTLLSSPQQPTTPTHPRASHLLSLLSPAIPSSTSPYKTLLAPMNSPFTTAWHIFRHTFRDLTLLAWEERFDVSKTLYKARAAHLGTEPFVYVRPKAGLPLGLRVQEAGLGLNPVVAENNDGVSGALVGGGAEEVYTRNAHSLPALTLALGSGIVGSAVQRDLDAVRDAAEKEKRVAEERARGLGLGLGQDLKLEKKMKKPDFSRPLFNGVTGRPAVDASRRYARGGCGGAAGSGRAGGSGLQGGVMKRRLFPPERREA
ncbi:uncharacterized protein EKO05_0007628 [Ascochyta rabiei]|uniref:uncharacterized protein n=1 Tax=Didymella rabiei TaxID=5454 RepID=UPI001902B7B3|nr:uncharacterized protein EKO05_0007628 [Ascochyta rabiei]UPX17262.1 hypothetical protein EKO05_0007628 [Ascochyta rabiei]